MAGLFPFAFQQVRRFLLSGVCRRQGICKIIRMVNSSGFRLMMMYSRAFLAVSVLVDLSAFIAVASTAVSEIPGTLGILVIMKIFITAVLVFLCRRSVSPDREFFYINLGFSPRRLAASAVGLDAGIFAGGLALITVIKYAL